MIMNAFRSVAAVCAAFAMASPASASTVITGIDALREWNLIVLGNAQSSSTVAGRSFIVGDLNGNSSGWYQGNNVPASPYATPGLTVLGNVNGGHKNIVGGANVGGTVNSGFNLNGAPQTVNAGGRVFNTNVNQNTVNQNLNNTNPGFRSALSAQADALIQSMGELSNAYAGLTATNTATFSNGGATFNVVPDSAGLAVFSLTGSQFNALNQITFNLNGADTVIVNVSGTTINNMANFNGNTAMSGRIIWNFSAATSYASERQMWGSLLAPNAIARIATAIDGSVVVKQMDQRAQIHLNTYQGSYNPLITAVPEPATWAMLVLGFGAIGAGLRSRRKARALSPLLG